MTPTKLPALEAQNCVVCVATLVGNKVLRNDTTVTKTDLPRILMSSHPAVSSAAVKLMS